MVCVTRFVCVWSYPPLRGTGGHQRVYVEVSLLDKSCFSCSISKTWVTYSALKPNYIIYIVLILACQPKLLMNTTKLYILLITCVHYLLTKIVSSWGGLNSAVFSLQSTLRTAFEVTPIQWSSGKLKSANALFRWRHWWYTAFESGICVRVKNT